ncbi:MAG: sigma-70 family RNA polymerase sigma factor [Chloroflexota bacterium]|nr:sigma-70 family RNA polymerase sigma factor [Chloroflexota bacterium]MDQ5865414.1 sigma-70 family RNA polymerase sigma factor [Chloroflexota bacterium]
MEDAEAVARLKRGDIEGLEVLVRRYHAQAVQSAYLVLGDWARAEDVAQTAFVTAYERISTFDSSRPFKPWFLRSVVHGALKVARARRDVSFEAHMESGSGEIPSPEPGVVEILEAAETREEVLAALDKLSPGQRASIVMKYYLDLSDVEVSEQLAVPPGTVRRRLHDARRRLRKLLPTY